MRIYAIFLYIVILNLVFGFVATAINMGWFIPEAQGVVTLPTTEKFSGSLNDLTKTFNNLGNQTSIGNAILSISFSDIANIVTMPFIAIFSVCGSLPAFVLGILGFNADVVFAFTVILTPLIAISVIFAVIQLISGKWFSFVE